MNDKLLPQASLQGLSCMQKTPGKSGCMTKMPCILQRYEAFVVEVPGIDSATFYRMERTSISQLDEISTNCRILHGSNRPHRANCMLFSAVLDLNICASRSY
jgi:hypothetical protein